MLYNSRTHLFLGKLKIKWSGPFKVTEVLANGVIEIENHKGERFKTNRQRLKKYNSQPLSVWAVNVMYVDKD